MTKNIANFYLRKFIAWAVILFVAGGAGVAIYSTELLPLFCLAYSVSAVFAGSNLLVMRKIGVDENKRFFKIFGWSFAGRFAGVVLILMLVLWVINIHDFFFTVSFLISYICHSVIEIIFINKILKTDTER